MTDINVDLDSILNEHQVIPRSIYDHRRMKEAMTAAIRADRERVQNCLEMALTDVPFAGETYYEIRALLDEIESNPE